MKREELLRHLRRHQCEPLREGSGHSVWTNAATARQSSIPRHREVNDYTAKAICKQLGIPAP